MKKVFAISGSTRVSSSNAELIDYIKEMSKDFFEIEKFPNVNSIPHFNPDDDYETPPKAVIDFRNKIRDADAVLICTPEYAMGVPGSLKNAFDWLVSSCDISKKPTALITASSLGQKGHASLMETLKIIEAEVTDQTQAIISFIKTKIVNRQVTDDETKEKIHSVIHNLNQLILAKDQS